MPDPTTPLDPWTSVLELYEAWYRPTLERLAKGYHTVDRANLHDACTQAILEIGGAIDRFDASRGTIESFLYRAARRCLGQLLRSDRRRRCREQKKAERDVAVEAPATRCLWDKLADEELARKALDRVAWTDQDRAVLQLWASSAEDVREYAKVLGIEDRPDAEQAATIKLVLDRLKQRLRRLRDRFPDPGGGT